jgi:mRNA interferase RelE/StbE
VVDRDLPDILEPWKSEIQAAIKNKLMTCPTDYSRPLRKSLKGYRKFRVGDYRIVFKIDGTVVEIFAIQHHSKVYESTIQRI